LPSLGSKITLLELALAVRSGPVGSHSAGDMAEEEEEGRRKEESYLS